MRALLFATCVVVGCSGNQGTGGDGGAPHDMTGALPAGAVVASGSVGGQALMLTTAIGSNVTVNANTAGLIVLTNRSDACTQLAANHSLKNLQALFFAPIVGDGSGTVHAPTAPGTFPVSPSGDLGTATLMYAGEIGFTATDASCGATTNHPAVGGALTLTAVGDGAYAGSFDLVLKDGSHVTGSFDTQPCAGLTGLGGSTSSCF